MYHTFCKRLSALLANITGLLLTGVLGLSMLNILLRNVFSVSWLILDVILKLMFVWMIFIGSSVVYFHGDHLKMDFFSMRFSPKVKKVFGYIFSSVSMLLLLVMLVYGLEVSRVRMSIPFEAYKAIPTGFLFASLPVCSVLMMLFTVEHLQQLYKQGSIAEEKEGGVIDELVTKEEEILKGIEELSSMMKDTKNDE
ncbi:TRAP transporter small permease subunit [Sphaerochaeta sp. PS]|uniref:TRAP transporter small permease n=1 Tax=Sphaerochaeta sp. PS TaxID=3076336 RepID=UPI0028A3896A|nr:TRAP transporter small permease subunit [Sphaerochaeta sp. PS]MDT4763351.1 TRAP transporter small permease subunit [Sphaerochaeta sp. PS]